jgi:cobalt-precorrin-5B (C1)-methyltransferase
MNDMDATGHDSETKELRSGFTTGTCAAAATKAAMTVLIGQAPPAEVSVRLPGGDAISLRVADAGGNTESGWAAVRKDAGDDPDVSDGVLVEARVEWIAEGLEIKAGQGVGTVTKPGLAVPPGQPAINPVPRSMIERSVRDLTDRGVQVTISIPGGEELAEKTFNPRLGVLGGLSILGTSGIVRPFSTPALRDALKCTIDVAEACQIKNPVLVPGRIGERAARRHVRVTDEQLIEVGNEWGFILDEAAKKPFERLLVLGHPGKLAKLADDQWDTHSSRSRSAAPMVQVVAGQVLGRTVESSATVEGVLSAMDTDDEKAVADRLAELVAAAVTGRVGGRFEVSVILVNLTGDIIGTYGDATPWQ